MTTPGIVLTSNLASEVVEFWGFKYKEVKEELEALKKAEGQDDNDTPTYGELKRLVQQLQADAADTARRLEASDTYLRDFIASSRNEQKAVQQKLDACTAEKTELLVQLARAESERVTLYHQIQISYSQAVSLAVEADRQRMAVIAELFPVTSFVEDSFTPLDASITKLYFLSRPPSAIPLRVPSVCQAGYWFYPFNLSPMDAPFELMVEVEFDKWLYFGRYVTRVFAGYEMKLSEWIALDEQIKLTFCARIASQKVPAGQNLSYTNQIDVRARYDSGQWNVPCYTLQCVGFDMALHDALAATAAKLCHEPDIPNAQSLGKRYRTETPSRSDITEGSEKSDGSVKKVRSTVDCVDELELNSVKGE
ncbi:hypothetical protein C8R44DRAFT_878417 [Mycena epipterygia]|nr:hypothetical protein C8R44DRAFT_878417 [Mycena epipterygia]